MIVLTTQHRLEIWIRKTSQDVLGLLKVTGKRFHQTIVMITHNEEIAQMADRILQIEDGKIVSDSGLA